MRPACCELPCLDCPPATSRSVVRLLAALTSTERLRAAAKPSTSAICRSRTPANRHDRRRDYLRRPDAAPDASSEMSSGGRWKCQAVKQYESAAGGAFREKLSVEAAFNAARAGSFADGVRMVGDLINLRYRAASLVVASAVNDIKSQWMTAEGTCLHRAKVANKLMAYYVVSLAIYIIEMCFWTNGMIIRVMGSLLLEPRDDTRVLYGACISAIFLLAVYLVGGGGTSSACGD